MNKIRAVLTKLLKQKNMSPIIGALINSYSSTSILFSPLTLIGVATTVYGLWGGEIIRHIFPWFQTWMLLAVVVCFVLVAMVVFYKVVVPSQYAFTVQQYYRHRNPMVDDINKCLENDEEIKKLLKEMNNRLVELEKK
jgi:large-conductance mechanosensitive channel